jgi:DNA-binding MarR family transcriptional regulator
MNKKQQYRLRAELKTLGVPSKSIKVLKVIHEQPGLTTTALGEVLGITKQAVSLHMIPLESSGVIANNHPHPLYKAWSIANPRVEELLTELSQP